MQPVPTSVQTEKPTIFINLKKKAIVPFGDRTNLEASTQNNSIDPLKKIKDLTHENADLVKNLNELIIEYQNLIDQVDKQNQKMIDLEFHTTELKARLESGVGEKTIADLKKQIQVLDKKQASLSDENKQYESMLQSTQNLCKNVQGENNTLNLQVAELTEKNKALQLLYDELIQNNQKLNKNLEEKEKIVEELTNQNNLLNKSVIQSKSDLQARDKKITQLEQEKSLLITEKKELQQKLDQKSTEIEDLNNQLKQQQILAATTTAAKQILSPNTESTALVVKPVTGFWDYCTIL